jgi:TonB family protein
MDAANRRSTKRVPTRAIWLAAVGTAFAINGTVLGAASSVDMSTSRFIGLDVPKVEPELVDLETSCEGDVLLASSARAAMCLAPWNRDNPECKSVDDLQMLMWMDLSACKSKDEQALPAVALATVQPREIEKVTPIDPEMLIDETKPPEQPKPPPPVPQLQPQQPPPPPPPAPAPPPPKRPQQVVETAKPNTEKEPENARFLAEHNTMVEKQKVARGAVKEPMVAKSKPAELTPTVKPPDEPPAIAKKPDEVEPGKNLKAPPVPGTLSMRAPGAPQVAETKQDALKKGVANEKSPIVANGGIPRRGDGAVEQQRRDPGELTRGQGGAGGGAPPVPNLKPSKEQLERIVGGGSVDHLEEVENGEETALNAKRWVFASFFNRMKRQVAQNWDPQTVWRRTDPQGTHHGFKTRVTEVRVVLGPKGDLQKVVVTAPSGVQELDDEAVRSFHAAAPFPNPPDGLVSKDGNITFAFSFYFEIGQSHTSWRVLRQ